MGRGLGPVQRKVIAHLTSGPRGDIKWMAVVFYSHLQNIRKGEISNPTKAQLETVRQAVYALERRKLIKRFQGMSDNGDPCWVLTAPVQTSERTAKGFKPRVVAPAPREP